MEIRDLKLCASDDKYIVTFKIYLPEQQLTLLACLKKGKRPGTQFICAFCKMIEDDAWVPHWEFDKEIQGSFLGTVRGLLKIAMDEYEHPMHS